MSNTAIVQTGPRDEVSAMRKWISCAAGAFAKILPKHVTPDRFLKVAHAAITKTPKLALCTPQSVIMALIHCSELGLEPNTPLQHAYIIPYEDKRRGVIEAQFQPGYRGLLHLARQSGVLASVSVEIVREGDKIRVVRGDRPAIEHEIDFTKKRGAIKGAYMIARLVGQEEPQREFMDIDDLHSIRDRSQGYVSAKRYGKTDHPWIRDESEMCRKTVFKRGAKWLELSPEKSEALARAIEIDNRIEGGARIAIPVDVLEDLPAELRPVDAIEEEPTAEATPEISTADASTPKTPAEEVKAQLTASAPPTNASELHKLADAIEGAGNRKRKPQAAKPADLPSDGDRTADAMIEQYRAATAATIVEVGARIETSPAWKGLTDAQRTRVGTFELARAHELSQREQPATSDAEPDPDPEDGA